MRELRFRAWCEEDKCLITDLNSPQLFHGELKDDDYILMQYTGLKDKNGKEIFEGDILECESKSYHKVIFESYFACFNTLHLDTGDVDDITKDGMRDCFTVIGNIYENPELLK